MKPGSRTNSAGIRDTFLLRTEAIGFPTFGFLLLKVEAADLPTCYLRKDPKPLLLKPTPADPGPRGGSADGWKVARRISPAVLKP